MALDLKPLFDPRLPLSFFTASAALSLATESLVKALEDVPYTAAIYLLAAGALATISVGVYRRWRRRTPLCLTGESAGAARALVMGVSTPDLLAVALDFHLPKKQLERVYLLYTEDAFGVDRLSLYQKVALERGFAAVRPIPLPPKAGHDPEVVYQALEQLYETLADEGIEKGQVLMDYTGGTKAFTAAMALFGAPQDRRLQYVLTDRDVVGLPSGQARCVEIDLDFKVSRRA